MKEGDLLNGSNATYWWGTLRQRIAAFPSDRRGTIAIMVATSFLVMLGMLGIAIDFARAQVYASRIYYAADATALALSRENFQAIIDPKYATKNDELTALANLYFDANVPVGYMGGNVIITAQAIGASPVQQFSMTVNASLPLVFGPLIEAIGGSTISTIDITKTSRALYTTQNSNKGGMEIVVVLDNSGSMRNEITNLKNAVAALITMLFGSDTTKENLYMGIVHYQGFVNVLEKAVNSKSDIISSVQPNTPNCPLATVSNSLTGVWHTSDTPPGASTYKFDPAQPTVTEYFFGIPFVTSQGHNCTTSTPGYSVALTQDRKTVEDAVAGYSAISGAYTLINEGFLWGWRMLSPRWRGIWKTNPSSTLPLNYGTQYMKKIIILMTDGQNEANTALYNANNDNLSTSSEKTKLNNQLISLCQAASESGIDVYTITYGSSADKTLMSRCASDPTMYFHATLPEDLKAAFTSVGTDVTTMKLIQ